MAMWDNKFQRPLSRNSRSTMIPPNSCTNSGKPAAQRCSRCSEGRDQDGEVAQSHYCNTECQKADWKKHQAVCRDRNAWKQLYRGAELVQEVFYAFREIAFDTSPTDIQYDGNKIDYFMPDTAPAGVPFYDFPDHLVRDAREKKAVLTWNSCVEMPAYMSKLLQNVFSGHKPTEVEIYMKKGLQRIFRWHERGIADALNYSHFIISVRLKSGEEYIVDPSGAQFRQYRAAMPRKRYMDSWAEDIIREEKQGYLEDRWQAALKYHYDPELASDFDYGMMYIQHEVAKAMNRAVDEWESKSGKAIEVMLMQKQDQYERDKADLLKVVVQAMQDRVHHWVTTEQKFVPPAEPRPEETSGEALDWERKAMARLAKSK